MKDFIKNLLIVVLLPVLIIFICLLYAPDSSFDKVWPTSRINKPNDSVLILKF